MDFMAGGWCALGGFYWKICTYVHDVYRTTRCIDIWKPLTIASQVEAIHLGKDHGPQKGARKKDQHEQEGKNWMEKVAGGLAGV